MFLLTLVVPFRKDDPRQQCEKFTGVVTTIHLCFSGNIVPSSTNIQIPCSPHPALPVPIHPDSPHTPQLSWQRVVYFRTRVMQTMRAWTATYAGDNDNSTISQVSYPWRAPTTCRLHPFQLSHLPWPDHASCRVLPVTTWGV